MANNKSKTPPDEEPSFHDLMQSLGADKLTPPTRPENLPAEKMPVLHAQPPSRSLDRQTILAKYYRRSNPPPENYKKTGMQTREFTRLKQGKLVPDQYIDFHNHTVAQTIPKLQQFINTCCQNQHRCVLIVCGKGKNSQDNQSILNHLIRSWLLASPWVLAYCYAKTHQGGSGALYVLLKKTRLAASKA